MATGRRLRAALIGLAIPAVILLALGIAFHRLAAIHVVAANEPSLVTGDRLLVERDAVRRRQPRRGDLVVARGGDGPLIGRVIALPGETIAVDQGAARLDGRLRPRWRVADDPNPRCRRVADATCRRPQMRTALPDGRWLDLPADLDIPARAVPPGQLLILAPGGARLAAGADIVGPARLVLLSLRGGARWREPATWLHAVRWERSGLRL